MKRIFVFGLISIIGALNYNCRRYACRTYYPTYHQNDRVLDGGEYEGIFVISPVSDNTSSNESYTSFEENKFISSKAEEVSTFGADVDKASYSNIRRFINAGQKPPVNAVRVEEMINYFKYDYPQPEKNEPLNVMTELTECPWNEGHQLLLIALQGKNIQADSLPATNLVFLVDVSGSMEEELPLLKESMLMLTEKLREKDRVSIVVYAGAAGCVLKSTPGSEKETIKKAIKVLESGGSTAGGEGIKLAYKIAKENFIEGGNNRIILATDGDFNVGVSDEKDLEKLIEEQRTSGVFSNLSWFWYR